MGLFAARHAPQARYEAGIDSAMLPSSSTRFGLNVTYASPPSRIIPSPTMIERRCCCASAVPIAPGEVPVMKPGCQPKNSFHKGGLPNQPRSSTTREWSGRAPE